MSVDRMVRVNELMKRELGLALFRVFQPGELDLAAVTITAVSVARNLRTAMVHVSILGHEQERDRMLATLAGRRAELQRWINDTMKLKYTPRLDFRLDRSLEKGDRVLDLLTHLEDNDA